MNIATMMSQTTTNNNYIRTVKENNKNRNKLWAIWAYKRNKKYTHFN